MKEFKLFDVDEPTASERPTHQLPSSNETSTLIYNPISSQREAEAQHRAVYVAYQDAIHKAGQYRAEISKGIQSGENLCVLFLKAIECISLMTGEPLFYTQNKEQIKAIYGAGAITQTANDNTNEYDRRIKKCFKVAYKFLEEHKQAQTSEEWEGIARSLALYTDPLMIDLVVSAINEIERAQQ